MAELEKERYRWWVARDLLELLILIAILVFIAVIYLPKAIWGEEQEIRDESRFRMVNVYDVLGFYKELTGQPTSDGLWALRLVNAARDSVTADSTFLGEQNIYFPDRETTVNISRDYGAAYDTSFGFLITRRDTLVDTAYTVVTFNEKESRHDTTFVRVELIKSYLEDSSFVEITDTVISQHTEVVSYYDSYTPDSSMFFCPLTHQPYIIEASEDHLKVESPIQEVYREPRYLVFSFKAESHGKIEDDVKSWAR